ncbi:MAG: UDP-N-acetylmuramoyl-L-alanyl-D-glutamate--2,6-diaminopimelate ligase [bacterium]
MKLNYLLSEINQEKEIYDIIEISGLSWDTRFFKKGEIFICLSGTKTNGHLYIEEAIKKGASCIIVEKKINNIYSIPIIKVKDTRLVLSKLSSKFYGNPSSKLKIIGVTGTNGKSTTCWMTESILSAFGKKCGLLSTVGNKINSEIKPASATTPEPDELHRTLKEIVDSNSEYAILEVSSHALSLNRVSQINFNTACFTNLTQDHLDFHHTLDEYFQAKLKLFTDLITNNSYAIINQDDPYADKIKKNTKANIITFGINNKAEIQAKNININSKEIVFQLITPSFNDVIKLNISGDFNVYNALASIGIAISQNIDKEAIKKGLYDFKGILGRFEKINNKQKILVIVDYAHTPDALERLLISTKKLIKGKIILVFGCGGNRDRGKRPLMGEIAAELADYSIITSDNPRDENPVKIILDIEIGFMKKNKKSNVLKIIDREEAIKKALSLANEDDAVIISGKGHENYQIIGQQKKNFSDQAVVKKLLL